MKSLNILIVEDELVIAENIKLIIGDLGYKCVGIARDYHKAVEKLCNNNTDIALLDIKIKGKYDGIDLAAYIRKHFDTAIIFITSYADKTTINRAKEVKPEGYLLKPFDKKDLFSVIEIGYSNFADSLLVGNDMPKQGEPVAEGVSHLNAILRDCIFIKKDYLLVKLEFAKIKYIKTDGNYIEIHCTGQKHLVRSTLKDFLKKLPANQFLQVHKSYSVNVRHIHAIDYVTVHIENEKIPIGRMFIENVKKTLNIEL